MQSAATAEKGRPDETTDELTTATAILSGRAHCQLAANARALVQRHMHACAQSSWPAPGPAARHMMHLLGKNAASWPTLHSCCSILEQDCRIIEAC